MRNIISMWENGRPSENGSDNGKDNDDNNKEKTIAKAAGFVVFSGIAMSILKAVNPFNNPNLNSQSSEVKATVFELAQLQTQPQVLQQCQPEPEPIVKKPNCCAEKRAKEASQNVIEIERGDTLWGLSRQYGVSIEAIKEANGLEGDTIYAGKKLHRNLSTCEY
uniref:Probable endopeptidase p60 isoform X2 n=1 Tax=Nicotiana tabacum TaxID=4097 RepID=A0A1S3ZDB5_TOBAC|nr:PREDICTED: probable endopeptidase p60 isoform X2 [Nicotiana tabacum]